jgi:hypothetical protein
MECICKISKVIGLLLSFACYYRGDKTVAFFLVACFGVDALYDIAIAIKEKQTIKRLTTKE